MNNAFRIDIEQIEAVFDWHPSSSAVQCQATLTFRMRPGQSKALFHFTPFLDNRDVVTWLELDGTPLDPQSSAELANVSFSGTTQRAVEIQRPLARDRLHTLKLRYHLDLSSFYPRFSAEVDDLLGCGNEVYFPTLNTPGEQARHLLTFRVHDERTFHFVGTGFLTTRNDRGVQEWTLDSRFPVSSYTLMFALLPASDSLLEKRQIGGIDVTILAFHDLDLQVLWDMLATHIPRLERDFGDFPAPWGMNIFAVREGWGMEYLGGTICVPVAEMSHEITHSYFGCAVTWKTYRDSWIDEAIASWLDSYYNGANVQSIWDGYTGNWVGSRSPISIGFSILAFSHGKSIMQFIADRLGGSAPMMVFLRHLYQKHAFKPLDTCDFVNCLKAYSGIDLNAQFLNWLYDGQNNYYSIPANRRQQIP